MSLETRGIHALDEMAWNERGKCSSLRDMMLYQSRKGGSQ